jgi:hypothetical protein
LLEALGNILNSGGQIAPTVVKLRRGLPIGGMSPGSDLTSGGLSYFFTRVQSPGRARRSKGFNWRANKLGRLDWIRCQGDKFGKTTGEFVIKNGSSGK